MSKTGADEHGSRPDCTGDPPSARWQVVALFSSAGKAGMSAHDPALAATAELLEGRLTDPFGFLGPHDTADGRVVRTFQPLARGVTVVARDDCRRLGVLEPAGETGLFVGAVADSAPYRLEIDWGGTVQETEDPYSFGLVLGELDLHLFAEGSHWKLAERFGAQPTTLEGVDGVA